MPLWCPQFCPPLICHCQKPPVCTFTTPCHPCHHHRHQRQANNSCTPARLGHQTLSTQYRAAPFSTQFGTSQRQPNFVVVSRTNSCHPRWPLTVPPIQRPRLPQAPRSTVVSGSFPVMNCVHFLTSSFFFFCSSGNPIETT